MIYDTENMLTDLKNLIDNELNTQITAVNTEKSDAIVLDTIPADHIILQSPTDNMLNFTKPFLMYGIFEDLKASASQLDNYIEQATFNIEIAQEIINEKELENLLFKLLRYNKALKALIMKNHDLFRGYGSPQMASLAPTDFYYKKKRFLSVGIVINASITAR